MLLAAPLALLLIAAAPSPDEGRGSSGTTPEEAVSARTQSRLRLGVAGAALFGLSSYTPALGVGVSLDFGMIVSDRLSLFVHGEVGSVVISAIGGGGLVAEYALGDHFTAGLGAAFMLWAPAYFASGGFMGITFPFRLSFAPARREANATRRTGLLIGLQVAPGVSVQDTSYYQSRFPIPPEPGFTAMGSVGYAWW